MMIRPGIIRPAPVVGSPSSCVWTTSGNPSGLVVSNAGKTATGPITYFARASAGVTSGLIYFEAAFSAFASISRMGWSDSATVNTSNELGDTGGSISYNPANGQIRRNGGAVTTLPTAALGDRLGFVLDYTNGKFHVRINGGNWNNTTDNPATNTGGFVVTVSGTMYPAAELYNGTLPSVTAYFSQSDWLYAAPAGAAQVP